MPGLPTLSEDSTWSVVTHERRPSVSAGKGISRNRSYTYSRNGSSSESYSRSRSGSQSDCWHPTQIPRHRRPSGTYVTPIPPNSKKCNIHAASTQPIYPGALIWATLHQTNSPDLPHNANGSSNLLGENTIHSKCRPAIVLAVFDGHFLVVPMTTFSKKGLSTLPSGRVHEYVGVVDGRRDRVPLEQEGSPSIYHPLKTVAESAVGDVLSTSGYAHVAAPVRVGWFEGVEWVGELDKSSLKALKKLWVKIIDVGI